MSCNIYNYKGKGYSEKDIKPVISYHYLTEEKLIEYGNDSIIKSGKVLQAVEDQFNVAYETVQRVNTEYGNVSDINMETGIINIDVTPVVDSIITPSDRVDDYITDVTTYKRKTYNLDNVDEETLEEFDNKVSLMESRFAEIGVVSHIVLDGDIADSGQLLGTDDKRYQEMLESGEISTGDAVIVVNPNNLFADTVFHEYGHLFIDLSGGMNNPRIKYAYAKIKNSNLANQVKEQYPELNEDMLAKEIMATAIGKEATDIFESGNPEIGFIQRFIEWIRNTIKGILAIPNSSIKTLANELLSNNPIVLDGTLNQDTQLFKGSKESRETRRTNDKFIKGAENVVKDIKRRANNLHGEIAKSTNKNKIDFKNRLSDLRAEIDRFSNASNLLSIDKFIEHISQSASDIEGYLQGQKNKANVEQIKIDYDVLQKIDLYTSLFDLINDVRKNINEGYLNNEFKEEGWTKENTQEFINRIDDAKQKYDRVLELRESLGRHHIANRLAKYSHRMTVERRVELEDQFKEETPYTVEMGTLTKYNQMIREKVNNQIAEELEQLQKDERAWIYERLGVSPVDIGALALWVNSEKDLNSMVIQMASKLLDEVDLKRDQKLLAKRLEAFEIYQQFDKETSGQDAKDKYKGLYQEGSDGKLYIAGEYDVEWFVKRQKLVNDYFKKYDDLGADHVETDKALKAWQKFDNLNSNKIGKGVDAVYRPKDKWKNKDYANIMSKPDSGQAKVLKFLTDQSIENHKNIHGNSSLIKSSVNSDVQFIQAPSIGRSTFEKASSGQLTSGIKDWFERLYKPKTDDTDLIGEVDEMEYEKLNLRVLANSKGKIKHGVPIHFRGDIALKDISYDLMSSIMMDTHMATNYHYKSGLQVELELMRDITANKKVARTQGFRKALMINALNKKEKEAIEAMEGLESNEYKKLQSMIEQRLYGIKTIENEYAKLASTLMSWTASSMLMFNLPSGVANLLQGKIFNFIEGVGGEHFNVSNLKAAEHMFFKDMKGWVDDIGRPVKTSKTNQLVELFNIQGEFKTLSSKFIENTRIKALAKGSTGYMFNHMGEFYMHGTLMYAILDKVKVQNSKKEYIDVDGNVTKNIDKAMSLAQAITQDEKGNLVLNKNVHHTTFGNSTISFTNLSKDKGLLEIRNLINKIAHDLHGNYNEEIASHGQRYIIGKMASMFRKWIVPGFNRRWRGAINYNIPTKELRNEIDNFYSEDLQSFQEGYYTTALRFLSTLAKDIKQVGFQAVSQDWNKLSDRERANMRRFLIEAGIFTISLAASYILLGLAGDIDDPIARESMFHMTYYTRRIFSEISFYSNPIEAFKIMSDPSATLAYVGKLGKFIGQMQTDLLNITTGQGLEEYERGKNTGQFKLWKRTGDLLPGVNQYYRDIEESTGWMFNVY